MFSTFLVFFRLVRKKSSQYLSTEFHFCNAAIRNKMVIVKNPWNGTNDLYYLESVRNDATVFPDISKENISAKIPTRCFSGTLPHSLTRTCSLFWGWLPFSGNKGRIWEFVPQKHWLTFEKVLFFYLIRGRKMHPFYSTNLNWWWSLERSKCLFSF